MARASIRPGARLKKQWDERLKKKWDPHSGAK
jgi:hypothetical protein